MTQAGLVAFFSQEFMWHLPRNSLKFLEFSTPSPLIQAPAWNSIVKEFAGNPHVVFGDVNLADGRMPGQF